MAHGRFSYGERNNARVSILDLQLYMSYQLLTPISRKRKSTW